MPTATDYALTHLSDDNHDLRLRIASLEADVVAYRALAQEAVHALAQLTTTNQRLTERLRQMFDVAYRSPLWSPPPVPAAVPDVDVPAGMVRSDEIPWGGA